MTEATDPPPQRKPRAMKQPRKDALRDEIKRLKAENEFLRMPWWRRIARRGN